MVAILSKFTVLCLSFYFVVYLFELKLILFYYRVIYYHTKIFLILLLYPVHVKIVMNSKKYKKVFIVSYQTENYGSKTDVTFKNMDTFTCINSP